MPSQSPSAMAQVCRSIADLVKAEMMKEMHISNSALQVSLDNPKTAAPESGSNNDKLNLFFYRFEPFEFDADVLPGETWLLRTHCLVTPFAASQGNDSAGENDLRLLGEAMRVFHETPVRIISVDDPQGKAVDFQIQTVFESLSTESINQIWSTQGESAPAYRPSVSYEISLAPILPYKKAVPPLLVGATGFRADGNMGHASGTLAGQDYSGIVHTPVVAKTSVDGAREDWAPAACFIYAGTCVQSLILASNDALLTIPDSKLDVLVAGKPGEKVHLQWEVWDQQSGWQGPVDASTASLVVAHDAIDPDAIPAADVSIGLPLTSAGQAVFYAVHTYPRAVDGVEISVRSNPLLLTIHEP